MCGFAGFYGQGENRNKILGEMLETIIHRGPDSEGRYLDEKVALGFRRLSIVDLSEHGNQPMFNEDESLVLTFNGEIYNYKELLLELLAAGHTFHSHTDSEVLLHGYEEWGTELVTKLRGMFAFVIWDKKKEQLFGARDMFGIKPFYYSKMENVFLFGSEIKSLLMHPQFHKELNEDALRLYLSFQFVPTDETFFKNVFCLPPAHYFIYDGKECKKVCYYCFDFQADSSRSHSQMLKKMEETLEESVQAHKTGDVEIGSYLSSGVDSSYLAFAGKVDRTYTVGFEGSSSCETEEAQKFAQNVGMHNKGKIISAKEYWDSLSDIQYYMDEPVADPSIVGLYFLSKEAAKEVKVVFSGEGSDELFGGYNIYCEPLQYTGFDKIPLPVRRMAGNFAEKVLPQGLPGRGFLIRHGKTLEERYYSNATNVFSERQADKILKKRSGKRVTEVTAPVYAEVADKDPVTKMQYVDLHFWLVHDILMKGDKMGMANSVEVRVPFLDKKMWEFARTLPLEEKVNPPRTKVLFREAAQKRISKDTAQKKKLGFPVPIRTWIRQEPYYSMIEEQFSSAAAEQFFHTDRLLKMLRRYKKAEARNLKTDDSRRIWTVFTFLLWYERFFGENGKENHDRMRSGQQRNS